MKEVKHQNKRKLKEPFFLKAIKAFVPVLEKISPKLAGKLAYRLFFYPVRFKYPKSEMEMLEMADKSLEKLGGKKVMVYQWGKGEKTVLLLHGWSGRATQFRKIITKLVESDYRVIAIDFPAHGKSPGRTTNIFDISKILLDLQKQFPKMENVITHSFGGVAVFHAMMEGFKVKTLTTIAAPVDPNLLLDEFFYRINGSEISRLSMLSIIENNFGRSFDSLSVLNNVEKIDLKKLTIIHDTDDKDASIVHSIKLSQLFPKAEYIETNGLGHNRILKSDEVARFCI